MLRMTIGCVVAMMVWAQSAAADPTVGSTIHVGDGLGDEASARLGSTIYVIQPIDGWSIGGELSGSIEGYTGGWGCGTSMSSGDDVVPALAVSCVQPNLAAHALVGMQASPSPRTGLRLTGGLGASSLWLLPGAGGQDQRDLAPSGLLRVDALFRAGEIVGATWWLGASLEERAIAHGDLSVSRSVGVVLEATSP
jgi:hypothetical protein